MLVVTLVFVVSCNTKEVKKENSMDISKNPLLIKSTLEYGTPDFTKIKAAHFLPAIMEGMKLQNKAIEKITQNKETPTF